MIINAGLFNTLAVDYDGGFTKDTNWSGDAKERVETVFCDQTWKDNNKLDCYAFFLENPTGATKMEAMIWHSKLNTSWVDLVATTPLTD